MAFTSLLAGATYALLHKEVRICVLKHIESAVGYIQAKYAAPANIIEALVHDIFQKCGEPDSEQRKRFKACAEKALVLLPALIIISYKIAIDCQRTAFGIAFIGSVGAILC